MKVKDLIEELKKFPEDLDVVGMLNDVEYGFEIGQEVEVYRQLVKNTDGIYGLTPVLQCGVQLPFVYEDVVIIEVC